eukprot:334968-Amphidinium_carterae.2
MAKGSWEAVPSSEDSIAASAQPRFVSRLRLEFGSEQHNVTLCSSSVQEDNIKDFRFKVTFKSEACGCSSSHGVTGPWYGNLGSWRADNAGWRQRHHPGSPE